jgi:glycosyltransferase involved in cell wall biosynthesis
MEICQLLVSGTGGLSKHVVELSNTLAKQGHSVITVAPEDCQRQLSAGGRYCHIKPEAKFRSFIYTLKLLFLVMKINPDVVHAHGKESSIHLARIKPFIRAKTVGTIHWHQKRKKDFRGFNRLDGVIGVGDGVFELLSNQSRAVIYNGVSEPKTGTQTRTELVSEFGLDPELPLALAIGRLVRGKGFHILLDAWRGIEANLLIIGDGPEYQSLCEQSHTMGLESRVCITGAIPAAARLFDVADLAVVTSYKEGFSYVIAESLMSETPVISTEINGADVLLPPHMVVPVGDAELLREKIIAYFSDKEGYASSFLDVFSWAKRSLTLEKMAENVVDFYKRVGVRSS